MNTPPIDHPAAAPAPPAVSAAPPARPGSLGRRLFLLALIALCLLLTGGLGYRLWLRHGMAAPPTVDLTGLDAEIVEAIETARAVVHKKPRAAGAWARLGAVYRAHEFNEEADFCFRQAEKLDPKDYRWPYLLGMDLQAQDVEASLVRLRQAVALCGDQTAPRLRLAEVLLDRGDIDEAEAFFRAVAEQDPNDARALLGLGNVALQRNDVDGALKLLRRAAARAPQATVVHAALMQAYRRAGDDKVVEEERRIVAELPTNRNWPDPALELIGAAWTGQRARMNQIDELSRRGYRAEAVTAARAAVEVYPESAVARLVLGEQLNRNGEVAAAEPVLREAMRMDPRRAKAHFELGYAFQQQGKLRDAIEAYQQALQLQADSPVAYFNQGLCFKSLHDDAGAEKAFRAALQYRPEYPEALMVLTQLLERQGRYQEALPFAQRAAHAAPSDPRPRQLIQSLTTAIDTEKQMREQEKKPTPKR
jgi:tetratricopeptide (TPR) repeat protein